MDAPPPAPSRSEAEARILGLISGGVSRDAATAWATQWIAAGDPGVDDPVVWRALQNLSGADAVSTDRPFLFEEVDFRAWLEELGEG